MDIIVFQLEEILYNFFFLTFFLEIQHIGVLQGTTEPILRLYPMSRDTYELAPSPLLLRLTFFKLERRGIEHHPSFFLTRRWILFLLEHVN